MGGTVAVGFRFSDGRTITQHRWTNSLPEFIHDVRLFNEDADYIQEYLNEADEDEDETNAPMAPTGYGLVLIDYISKRIYSMQGYTSFGRVAPANILTRSDHKNDAARYNALLSAGRISEKDLAKSESRPLDQRVVDYESLVIRANELWNIGWLEEFLLDMSPLQVVNFEDDSKGAKEFRRTLTRAKFPLTKNDRAAWRDYITDHDG